MRACAPSFVRQDKINYFPANPVNFPPDVATNHYKCSIVVTDHDIMMLMILSSTSLPRDMHVVYIASCLTQNKYLHFARQCSKNAKCFRCVTGYFYTGHFIATLLPNESEAKKEV